MKFINDMRERPEDERMAFATIAAGIAALVLFLLWGVTFFNDIDNNVYVEVPEQNSNALQNAKNEFGNAIDEFGDQYNQIRQILEEENAIVPSTDL